MIHDDLLNRLRDRNFMSEDDTRKTCIEAADEIESLRKQLEAFYRLQTSGMKREIDKGINSAQ